MHLKILSYNWHEPYLCLLSKIGHTFLIVEPKLSEGKYRRWDKNMRPIPDNVILLSEKEAISQLDEGAIDLLIAHNIKDIVNVHAYSLPKILVFHNKLTTEIKLGNNNVNREDYLKKIKPLVKNVKKIFISESKRLDWGLDGDVILPGIDVNDYGGYIGDNPSILRVGNMIKERDIMMGFTVSESILLDLPSKTLGMNPTIIKSRLSSGFDDLLDHYRSLRVYLHTTSNCYEDGYNLSLLEAMAVGMPVLSILNNTSPIRNEDNGYISDDIQYLRSCAVKLLGDQKLAYSLGQKARETVRDEFSQTKFLQLWIKSIEETIIGFLKRSPSNELIEKNELSSPLEKTSMPQYFKNIRDDIVSLIPDDSIDILEIGCAAGMTGKEIKKNPDIYVAGVELDHMAAVEAKKHLDDVFEGNIETIQLPFPEKRFDCIIFADILEHLVNPLTVLKKTRKFLRPDGAVIASIPNVQYLGVISQLVEGNWTYQDEGILDRTHLRFFTYPEIVKLFDEAGYRISSVDETLDPQYKDAKNQTTTINIGRLSIKDLSIDELKRFFVYQYKITAKLKNNTCGPKQPNTIKEDSMQDVLSEGKLLENNGSYRNAIKVFSTVSIDHNDYAESLARIGNCYMQLQDITSAENYYQKSLNVETQGYVASVGLGLLEVQLNKTNEAIKRFLNITQKYPDSDKAFSGLGIAYSNNNNIPEAMNAFTQALKLNITNKIAMHSLLDLSYQRSEFHQIEISMKRYLESYPDNTDILFGLAGILYKAKRFEEAHNTLSLLLKINPKNNDANIMLKKIDVKREKVC
jgi:tetratricopeptide (TPR) repeat protein/glycosyltransferase involved in cell wall biosynthesis